MDNKPFSYTILDACRVSGIGRTTLYRLIAEGKVDARKAGSRTLIITESLLHYIKNLESANIGALPADRS